MYVGARVPALNCARYADELMRSSQSYKLTYRQPTHLGGDQVLTEHEVEMKGASSAAETRVGIFTVYTVREGAYRQDC